MDKIVIPRSVGRHNMPSTGDYAKDVVLADYVYTRNAMSSLEEDVRIWEEKVEKAHQAVKEHTKKMKSLEKTLELLGVEVEFEDGQTTQQGD